MHRPIDNLHLAVKRFVDALHDYQSSTCRMNQALLSLSRHNVAFCRDLQHISTAVAPTLTRQPA